MIRSTHKANVQGYFVSPLKGDIKENIFLFAFATQEEAKYEKVRDDAGLFCPPELLVLFKTNLLYM